MILSTAYFDVEELESASLIDLYELKVPGLETVFRFHSGSRNAKEKTKEKNSVYWQGEEYFYFPVEAKGFEYSGTGKQTRPRLKVSNLTHVLPSFLEAYEDFLGGSFKRIRVYDRFLDSESGDYSEYRPFLFFPVERYIVERKVEETPVYVEFELISPLDVQGLELPRRKILQRYCSWEYRKPGECSYHGKQYFNLEDELVQDSNLDRCAKKLSSCKKRFGSDPLLFSGFPSISSH